MVEQETIRERPLWIKWGLLLVVWILCALVLIVIAGNNQLSTRYNQATSLRFDRRMHQNELKSFHYRSWNPKRDYCPIFSICFQSLCAENNNLGFFKTALHKVVRIHDLKLRLYQYYQENDAAAATHRIHNVLETAPGDIAAHFKNTVRRLTTPMGGWRLSNFDIGNVSEILASGFNCTIFHNGVLHFAAQSRRAIVSYKDSDLILRGIAKVTIADGSTLESNEIKWDVKRQCFSARGVYVLKRRGIITTGKGIYVNDQLESINGRFAQSERKEQKCIAGL